jgi:hypothetical protein
VNPNEPVSYRISGGSRVVMVVAITVASVAALGFLVESTSRAQTFAGRVPILTPEDELVTDEKLGDAEHTKR